MTSEQDLIIGCKKGSHSAFEALYTKYAGRMMAIALRYCNTTFEAEDMVQETFIKVFERIKDFDTNKSFVAWLTRVLINHCIDHYHRSNDERIAENNAAVEQNNESLEDVSRITNEELMEALKKLPFGYKTVFNLYVIEGYTHKEIAEVCEISEGTSKSQLSKAKVMLKELLSKNFCVSK
jgi:RNA polymerase sigma factor (sigma-70 family)